MLRSNSSACVTVLTSLTVSCNLSFVSLSAVRIGVVGMVFFGSLHEAKAMWDLGDIGVGTMAWVNIIAILLLSPKAFKALRSYERQKKEGKDPVFDPKEIGVKGADFWEKR